METLLELIEAFAWGAVAKETMVRIDHVGDPCRYVAFDPETGILGSRFMQHGDWILVQNNMRLVMEPLIFVDGQLVDRVRSICNTLPWVTQ